MTFDQAWKELVERWMPGDPFQPTAAIRQYYAVKWGIARRWNPGRILEIGVRAGYSAFMFLRAAPRGARYLGIDSGLCDFEGRRPFLAHAEKLLSGYDALIWRVDAGSLRAFPVGPDGDQWELAHIDGDHSYDGCLHDLRCAARFSRRIVVDDYDTGPEIRRACADFLQETGAVWKTEEVPDGGVAGNLLLSSTGAV